MVTGQFPLHKGKEGGMRGARKEERKGGSRKEGVREAS